MGVSVTNEYTLVVAGEKRRVEVVLPVAVRRPDGRPVHYHDGNRVWSQDADATHLGGVIVRR